jgi:hypothetical protein
MIVMTIAITPSVNASSLVLDTVYPGGLGDGASAAKERPFVWLRPSRPPGTLIRKIQRQLPASSSHPPTKGATAADTPLNPAHVPMACVRSPGWRVASMQALEAGVQVPPDRWQRDGDHGGADPRHRRPQDHRRDHPPASRRAVAEQFARAGAISRVQPARLSARIWWHWPDLPVCRAACHGAAGLAAAAPPVVVTQRSRLIP